ncbi:MAG: zinc ABC transporter substrate-binding protein [Spirochaetales bacterium]|nr:zinc ABC transporter substrate-binding protein [Spirochaetales bacterium]
MKASTAALAAAFLLVVSTSCAPSDGEPRRETATVPGLVVAVTVPPQAYFARRVAGERAVILTVVPPGSDPHTFEPSPRQVAELSRASAWFLQGIETERSLAPRLASLNPTLRLVDANSGARLRSLEAHDHETEADGGAEEHDEPLDVDPHTWLGLDGALSQAANMARILSVLDPPGAATYEANRAAFERDARKAFAALEPLLAPLRGSPVFVYHPAFGYFLDHFGIEQAAVETGGKEPTQKALAALIRRAREEGVRAIFVQAQFSTAAAETVAEAVGAAVVPIEDLAEDWLANLARIGTALGAGR